MAFEDILAKLREPGEEGITPELFDELKKEYDQDLSIRDAKVTQTTTAAQAKDAEIQRLKVINFDLLQSSGSTEQQQEPEHQQQEPKPRGIASLFE